MKLLLLTFAINLLRYFADAKLYYIEAKYPLLVSVIYKSYFTTNNYAKDDYIFKKEPPIDAQLSIPTTKGSLWPMPQFVNESSKALSYLTLENFRITSNLIEPCDIIEVFLFIEALLLYYLNFRFVFYLGKHKIVQEYFVSAQNNHKLNIRTQR